MHCPSDAIGLPQKPVKHSKRTDQIMRLLKDAYSAQLKHATGKAFITLALKIERILYREFPDDSNIVLSPPVLALKLRLIISKILKAKIAAPPPSRPFSIQSMLN
ncbi:unnamed protein product [Aphanomyces euteiches]|uniref:Uncharacterized protein n=1 Tax=Aphanomyces euteiches TaxID=100861 RepID=A0A6G0WQV4_9STRA|nr:hypothetical protein Ae201684_012704 [Aphanomyces euteiches]KAH9095632.1 hypothetical protein Ae201684P_015433 [Aphanomyces euteiches]KAH9146829.1 hypothetical protein AeRB84_009333 [Aphanomyces euteiches]